jgi:hypothetical protein
MRNGKPLKFSIKKISTQTTTFRGGDIFMSSRTKTRKNRIETAEQAKDFIAGKMCKVLNDCLDSDINDNFACEVILAIAGGILLSRGEIEAFQYNIKQIVEHNQEVFEMDGDEPDDDGTFH